jgi:hypothetical protein
MSHDDFELDPDPAMPGQLPAGEVLLWQGRPDWMHLAWRVYHLREVMAYFALLIAWRGFSSWWETASLAKAMLSASPLLVPLLIATLLLAGLGVLSARTTLYTITSSRLVLKIGIAMPTNINLPFTAITTANLRLFGNSFISRGRGDIGVEVADAKIAYALLWPHARPWKLRQPQPMLRSLPDAAIVADLLAKALSGERVGAIAGARNSTAKSQPQTTMPGQSIAAT